MVAGVVYYGLNDSLRPRLSPRAPGDRSSPLWSMDGDRARLTTSRLLPLAWLMSLVYELTWWATLLFAVPLYITRIGYQRFVEMRLMFTQTIGALAEAVDKRDPFTASTPRT